MDQSNEVDHRDYAESSSEENINQSLISGSGGLSNVSSSQHLNYITTEPLSLSEKFGLIPGLLKYMVPLGLIYFFEYIINQGM